MAQKLVAYYYLMTPGFWFLDTFLGTNVRTSALDGYPGWRTLYYLLCVGCAIVMSVWPASTRVVALSEASANILLYVLSVLLPVYRIIDAIARNDVAVDYLSHTPAQIINMTLSTLIWVVAFKLLESERSA